MKTCKKILAIVLAISCVISMFAFSGVSASAATTKKAPTVSWSNFYMTKKSIKYPDASGFFAINPEMLNFKATIKTNDYKCFGVRYLYRTYDSSTKKWSSWENFSESWVTDNTDYNKVKAQHDCSSTILSKNNTIVVNQQGGYVRYLGPQYYDLIRVFKNDTKLQFKMQVWGVENTSEYKISEHNYSSVITYNISREFDEKFNWKKLKFDDYLDIYLTNTSKNTTMELHLINGILQ